MMKKAQSLVIGLWILVILSLLAIGIAHRVSLALRLSRYHREGLKASYLANAGLNLAIKKIEGDSEDVDSLKDKWADNLESFERIFLDAVNESEFAVVSYIEEDEGEGVIFGVVDEERKININTAPQDILTELLDSQEVSDPATIANNIRAWRGDTGLAVVEYDDLGYANKSAKFSNIEELRLVKGVTSEIYDLIKGLITVYPKDGEGRVNINTASKDVLEILINTSFNKLEARGVDVENPLGLLEAIITFRERNDGVFDGLDIELKLGGLISDLQKNIITDSTDGLKYKIGVQSDNFRIISEGNVLSVKLKSKINCVYSRKENKIISWHQN